MQKLISQWQYWLMQRETCFWEARAMALALLTVTMLFSVEFLQTAYSSPCLHFQNLCCRINSDFTLADFKNIYFWEYAHRMFGRGIGLAFVGPLAYFWAKGKLPRYLKLGLPVLLGAGASQVRNGLYLILHAVCRV